LTARIASDSAHLAHRSAGIGITNASLKLTEQIKTDLLCCLYLFPKESVTNRS